LEKKNTNISTFNLLKKINNHLDVKRKRQVTFVFIISLLSSLAESISIALLIPFISFFINPESYLFNSLFLVFLDYLNITNQKDIMGFVTFIFIFIVLISCLIKYLHIKNSNKLSENIASDFRVKIFNFLINQDYSYYFKHGTSEIMSNLAQKAGSFTVIVFATMNIINAILISIAVVIVLTINEPFYTPIIIFTLIVFFITVYKIKSRSVFKKGQNVNLNQNIIIDIFENTVGYLQEVLIYNLKNFFLSTLTKASKETAKSSSDIRNIAMFPRIYLETFVIVFVVLLIYFSDFSERSVTVNISYLAILAFGAQKCLPLINSIYTLSINFKAAIPTVLSFIEILENGKKNLILEDDKSKTLDFKKEIILKKIFFQYDQGLPNIFKDINLEIKKGEKIAIKGQTGSGKSTLVNLISGLINPSQGKILIDNVELNADNKKNWQRNIAIVPQSVFLNDASILENIAIGENLDEISFTKAQKAAEISQIDKFINTLPKKYNETVGERGVRLSGGQKQRIGIARALYRNPNILILDEPTNALDLETEELVLDSVIKYNHKITIIMISHSNNSLKFFDRIIDLEKFN
jgi:ATP-binding cassette, subfamily B, bacterial PglK